ncbi:MAG: hypothetical protein KBT27_06205 [Prevotellaceae bacterium]|nr:hypothetical protein [Candidatus Faecinaster equi]
MLELIKENSIWITPVFVAIVSGVFYLLKKGGNHQKANNNNHSKITQINGNYSKDEKQ